MLTSVGVFTVSGDWGTRLATLDLRDVTSGSRYIVRDIGGLEPTSATISSTDYAIEDGGRFQNSRVGSRNILLNIEYNIRHSTLSVEELRWELYRVLSPKSSVRLRFFHDTSDPVDIVGHVESHESAIFTRDPMVTISLVCPNPYFQSSEEQLVSGVNNVALKTDYEGTAKTGFVLTVNATRNASAITIDNQQDTLVFGGFLSQGDTLTISTVPGQKYVRQTKSGVVTNMLDMITEGSLALYIDSSHSEITAKTQGQWNVPLELRYRTKYSGV